jgi:hypothetical protein
MAEDPGRGDYWGEIPDQWGDGNEDLFRPPGSPYEPGGDDTAPPTDAQSDAFSTIKELLGRYGLDGLAEWAWQRIVDGDSETQILQSLRDQDLYRTRFRAIFDRETAGLPPVSPEEVLAYERQAVTLMRSYGFPESFWDTTDDLANLIVADVSPVELEERLQGYVEAAVSSPQEYRDALERNYGFAPGDLAAVFADPEQGWQVLQRKWRASRLAGEAGMQGWGDLTASEAERLDAAGLDSAAAREGFGALRESSELFRPLDGGEQAVSRETQLGVLEGDQEATAVVERQRARRLAQFSGGGGFAGGSEGLGGVGTSS